MQIASNTETPGQKGTIALLCSLLVACSFPCVAHEAVHHDATPLADLDSPKAMASEPLSGVARISVTDSDGDKTPTLLGFKDADTWSWIAVDETILPNPRHPMQRSQRRQWKSRYPINSCGHIEVPLAPGNYVVTASKGLEYIPAETTFTIQAGKTTDVALTIQRFVDMPSKGWWSGDTHVHVGRESAADNANILCAAEAEDIHVTSLLAMSRPDGIEFLQYGFGKNSTIANDEFWLVPGQEGPRTQELGHVIMLNTEKMYHEEDRYYDYPGVISAARKDGSIVGFAHYFEEKFFPERSGAVLFHYGLIDFVELIDDTNVFRPEHYYQLLNLGFRVPLVAGSDFPWGDHIGDQRTYAYLGKGTELTPKTWYESVEAGRTFVTQGPLIDLTVNGQAIGSEVRVSRGDKIVVEARALGYPRVGSAKQLSIVSMGDALETTSTTTRSDGEIVLEYSFNADKSVWLSASVLAWNHSVALTSPIYVIVDSQPILATGQKLDEAANEMLERLEFLQQFNPVSDQPEYEDFRRMIGKSIDYYKGLLSGKLPREAQYD